MRISDLSSDVCSSDLFGAPQSLRLKTAWHLMDSARRGLFCQLVLIPLLRDHQVLCQVSGDDSYIIKLLPSLTIDESDRDRKSVVEGTSVSVSVIHGGRRIIKKKKNQNITNQHY